MKKLIAVCIVGLAFAGVAAGHDHRGPRLVRALADDLDDVSRQLYRAAERTTHHRSYWDRRALDELYDLRVRTVRLNRSLDRRWANAFFIERDLRRIERALNEATFAVRRSHAKKRVRMLLRETRWTFGALQEANRRVLTARSGSGAFGFGYRDDDRRFDRFDDDDDDRLRDRRAVPVRTRPARR